MQFKRLSFKITSYPGCSILSQFWKRSRWCKYNSLEGSHQKMQGKGNDQTWFPVWKCSKNIVHSIKLFLHFKEVVSLQYEKRISLHTIDNSKLILSFFSFFPFFPPQEAVEDNSHLLKLIPNFESAISRIYTTCCKKQRGQRIKPCAFSLGSSRMINKREPTSPTWRFIDATQIFIQSLEFLYCQLLPGILQTRNLGSSTISMLYWKKKLQPRTSSKAN